MLESERSPEASEPYTTLQVARLLGLAVRSVQLMVDRGELEAWKTPGGHRRISRASVQRWLQDRRGLPAAAGLPPAPAQPHAAVPGAHAAGAPRERPRVLLIEDSVHYQHLVSLLLRQRFPQVDLRIADDGIAGLAMVGSWAPDVLIVDILLPGIDGATLITSLRSHPEFERCRLIVITSLDDGDRAPYAFALAGLPLVHKSRLVMDLPQQMEASLAALPAVPTGP